MNSPFLQNEPAYHVCMLRSRDSRMQPVLDRGKCMIYRVQ
jgi:hypothetical protein